MQPLICHVAETLRGGTASYLDEILPAQVRTFGAGRVHVLIPDAHARDLALPPGVVTHHFVHDGRRGRHVLRLAKRFLALRSQLRPDVIHVHGTFAGVAIRPLQALATHRAALVYCAHGWAFDREVSGWQQTATALVERALSCFDAATVCISHHDYQSARTRGLRSPRLRTIRNGIGMPASHGPHAAWPDGTARRVLFVGRFDHQKGVDVLLDAMQALDGQAYAWLAGGAVVSESLQRDWPRNVGLAGWIERSRLQAYYNSCDLVVVPSRWEGFGLVALEAMRAGKPVVAPRVGGLTELVVHGKTGLLVKPGDPQALASAIMEPTPEALRTMGECGRLHWQSEFSADRLDRELKRLYADVLASCDRRYQAL